MSVIPFTTQAKARSQVGGSQSFSVVLLYTNSMTERQSTLMRECQDFLNQNVGILIKKVDEIKSLSTVLKFFVIPSIKEDVIKKIRDHFEKPIIYLPRAVIEARGHHNVNLPVRRLALSLTMIKTHVFLVKSCDVPSIRDKINVMCGRVVTSFDDPRMNVVITDRADNKYCSRAFKKNIPVVSRGWADNNYKISIEEDSSLFNIDALRDIAEQQIKPFYGLYFKLNVQHSGTKIKKLIMDNQGHIIYGNENCLTHIVGPTSDTATSQVTELKAIGSQIGPKIVDLHFLEACVEAGYYLSPREYREQKLSSTLLAVKQELYGPTPMQVDENSYYDPSENNIMLPPPSKAQSRPKHNEMALDIINQAMLSIDTTHTQIASSQMRRMPDQELRFEQTIEPSQQLYWKEK